MAGDGGGTTNGFQQPQPLSTQVANRSCSIVPSCQDLTVVYEEDSQYLSSPQWLGRKLKVKKKTPLPPLLTLRNAHHYSQARDSLHFPHQSAPNKLWPARWQAPLRASLPNVRRGHSPSCTQGHGLGGWITWTQSWETVVVCMKARMLT